MLPVSSPNLVAPSPLNLKSTAERPKLSKVILASAIDSPVTVATSSVRKKFSFWFPVSPLWISRFLPASSSLEETPCPCNIISSVIPEVFTILKSSTAVVLIKSTILSLSRWEAPGTCIRILLSPVFWIEGSISPKSSTLFSITCFTCVSAFCFSSFIYEEFSIIFKLKSFAVIDARLLKLSFAAVSALSRSSLE